MRKTKADLEKEIKDLQKKLNESFQARLQGICDREGLQGNLEKTTKENFINQGRAEAFEEVADDLLDRIFEANKKARKPLVHCETLTVGKNSVLDINGDLTVGEKLDSKDNSCVKM